MVQPSMAPPLSWWAPRRAAHIMSTCAHAHLRRKRPNKWWVMGLSSIAGHVKNDNAGLWGPATLANLDRGPLASQALPQLQCRPSGQWRPAFPRVPDARQPGRGRLISFWRRRVIATMPLPRCLIFPTLSFVSRLGRPSCFPASTYALTQPPWLHCARSGICLRLHSLYYEKKDGRP